MGFFNWGQKQKQQTEKIKPIEFKCNHKWKDFPWYVSAVYYNDTKKLEIKIFKPYVCIHCKERKDVLLHKLTRINISWEDANVLIDDYDKKYGKYCEARPIVENMINDMQLVDREYLRIIGAISDDNQVPKLKI